MGAMVPVSRCAMAATDVRATYCSRTKRSMAPARSSNGSALLAFSKPSFPSIWYSCAGRSVRRNRCWSPPRSVRAVAIGPWLPTVLSDAPSEILRPAMRTTASTMRSRPRRGSSPRQSSTACAHGRSFSVLTTIHALVAAVFAGRPRAHSRAANKSAARTHGRYSSRLGTYQRGPCGSPRPAGGPSPCQRRSAGGRWPR